MADNRISFTFEINDKGKVKVDGLTRSFVNMDTAVKKVTNSIKQQQVATTSANNAMRGTISDAGLAGATLTELGRTISDSNYGIRGMANNLSQLSTLFITLVAKRGGGVNGFGLALRQLGKQLMGPLGIILAFQTVITLLERFAMKQDEARESTESLTASIDEQISTLEALGKRFFQFNLGGKALAETVTVLRSEFSEFDKAFKNLGEVGDEEIQKLIQQFLEYKEVQREIMIVQDKLTNAEEDNHATRTKLQNELFNLIQRRAAFEQIFKKRQDKGSKEEKEEREKQVSFLKTFIRLIEEEFEKRRELSERTSKSMKDESDARKKDLDDFIATEKKKVDEVERAEKLKANAIKRSKDIHLAAQTDLINGLAALGEKNKELAIAAIVAEKLITIASIIGDTRETNMALRASATKAGGVAGFFSVEGLIAMNNVASGISIAATAASAAAAIRGVRTGQDQDIGGLGSSGGARATTTGGPTFNVVGASQFSQLAQAVEGRDEPIRAYVVASDVTNMQQLENNISNAASI